MWTWFVILLYTNIHISVTQCHTCISAYIERGREKKETNWGSKHKSILIFRWMVGGDVILFQWDSWQCRCILQIICILSTVLSLQAPEIVVGEGPPAPRLSLQWSCSVDQGIWKDLKEIGLQLHGFGAVNGSISGKKRGWSYMFATKCLGCLLWYIYIYTYMRRVYQR